MQMAMSEYRGGQWTPKRVSTAFAASQPYTSEIVNHYYSFSAVDRTEKEGRFFISYEGYSRGKTPTTPAAAYLKGEAEMAGCGIPDFTFTPKVYTQAPVRPMTWPDPLSTGRDPVDLRWQELSARQDAPDNDLAFLSLSLPLEHGGSPTSAQLLRETPGLFQLSPGWHQSYLNRLNEETGTWYPDDQIVIDGWLPFFYRDGERSFFVLPTTQRGTPANQPQGQYYTAVKAEMRSWERYFATQIDGWLDGFLEGLTPAERTDLAGWLAGQLNLPTAPVTDDELKAAIRKDPQQAVYFWMVGLADQFIAMSQFHFQTFYHPLVCEFGKLLNDPLRGVPALMSRYTQLTETAFRFYDTYRPTASVVLPTDTSFYPKEIVDFTPGRRLLAVQLGAVLPRAAAHRQLAEQEPALRGSAGRGTTSSSTRSAWRPRCPGGSPMSKYWITKPFFETTDAAVPAAAHRQHPAHARRRHERTRVSRS